MNNHAVIAAKFCSALTLVGSGWSAPADPPPAPAPPPPVVQIADIPANYQQSYMNAVQVCPGMPWTLPAAIGRVETEHGREKGTHVFSGENSAGAAGPMQFLQGTWDDLAKTYPDMREGSRYDIATAARGTVHYLCENHALTDPARAIHAYNPWDTYVMRVLQRKQEYDAAWEHVLQVPK